MRNWPPTRVLVYVGALVLAASAFIAGGVLVAKKRDVLQAQAQQWQFENFELLAQCKAAFLDLHAKRLHYEITRAPADRATFEGAANALSQLFLDRSREVMLPETRAVWEELGAAYARYRTNVARLLANLPPSQQVSATNELFSLVDDNKNRFLALDARLARAKRSGFETLIFRLRQEADVLWMALYVMMGVLLVCIVALAGVVYRDWIAPLRRTVAQSQAALERQEKLSSLGLLTAGIAHEIRNPLNSIKARLFTQRRLLGPASAGLEDNEFIEGEIDRLESIVKDALQFARPPKPAVQRVPIVDVLEPLRELLRPALEMSGLELRADFGFNPEVSLDPNQIKQAILNLVNNARESTGRGGVITLRTRRAWLRRRNPALAIEVEDTGKGISPEVRKRLFDPFFTTREDGTGLGLPITARIVHAHGGVVECESQPGRGARFRIIVPLLSAHEKDPHPAH